MPIDGALSSNRWPVALFIWRRAVKVKNVIIIGAGTAAPAGAIDACETGRQQRHRYRSIYKAGAGQTLGATVFNSREMKRPGDSAGAGIHFSSTVTRDRRRRRKPSAGCRTPVRGRSWHKMALHHDLPSSWQPPSGRFCRLNIVGSWSRLLWPVPGKWQTATPSC